jgi:hypothetical protein
MLQEIANLGGWLLMMGQHCCPANALGEAGK